MTTIRAGASREALPGKLAYGALFLAVLPLALVLWANRLDSWIPLVRLHSLPVGVLIAVAGAGLVVHAMAVMWIDGGGLPASPYPPERLVTSGPYRVFAHPIYVGSAATALGVAVALGSPGGVWIVTPTLAAAAAAWVWGFERELTRRRFGSPATPLMSLAPPTEDPPTRAQRGATYLTVYAPWLLLYVAVELLAMPPDARSTFMRWEGLLPVWPMGSAVHVLLVPYVLAVPLIARRQRDLREFSVESLWAIALVFTLDLLIPFSGTYHLVWAFIATAAWVARYPRARLAIVSAVALVAAGCIVSAVCATADVAAAIAALFAVRGRRRIGRLVLDLAEWIANSWREWRVGPVRLLSHGIYAGVGAALGVGLAAAIAGASHLPWLVALTAAAIVGAGVWAQVVEGSSQLLRPYGYFGAVFGVLMVLAAAALSGVTLWITTGAFCIGCTVTYALGRMRCLVQGCCHGTRAPAEIGIVYRDPHSRVCRLSTLGGVPVHATPMYSALWMLLVGAVLLRLWSLAAPVPFIVGAYFMLTGLGRFVEEHYRGEPQTLVVGGMRLYQWLAIGLLVIGALITAMDGPRATPFAGFGLATLPALLFVTAAAYVAYGVDFPRSNRRFSRLV